MTIKEDDLGVASRSLTNQWGGGPVSPAERTSGMAGPPAVPSQACRYSLNDES